MDKWSIVLYSAIQEIIIRTLIIIQLLFLITMSKIYPDVDIGNVDMISTRYRQCRHDINSILVFCLKHLWHINTYLDVDIVNIVTIYRTDINVCFKHQWHDKTYPDFDIVDIDTISIFAYEIHDKPRYNRCRYIYIYKYYTSIT